MVHYLLTDQLGSTAVTASETGALEARQWYYPFGGPRANVNNLPTDRRFTGQRSEEATLGSLYDFVARPYSATLGRFLAPDSIVPEPGNPQSLNRYSYALNAPLRYVDPTGHCVEVGMSPIPCVRLIEQFEALTVQYGPQISQATQAAQQWLDKVPAIPDQLARFAKNTAGKIQRALGGGDTGNPDPNNFKPETGEAQKLVDELTRSGVNFSPDKIVRIARTAQGRIVWLEQGTEKSGLQHILKEHGDDFSNKGVSAGEVPDLIMKAVTQGKLVGYAGRDREVYEVVFNNVRQFVAVTIGSNGYLVGANPVSWP